MSLGYSGGYEGSGHTHAFKAGPKMGEFKFAGQAPRWQALTFLPKSYWEKTQWLSSSKETGKWKSLQIEDQRVG